ncbi:MAG: ankyrin repeat domain-containing protein [Halobacteriovoraceae bacterium]|nr:ankyrin repeat domain-containing protein [Halobacteriovoraceae bacterium]
MILLLFPIINIQMELNASELTPCDVPWWRDATEKDVVEQIDNPDFECDGLKGGRIIHAALEDIYINPKTLDAFLDMQPDLSTRTKYGDTAVHMAVYLHYRNIHILRSLLEMGADANITNVNWQTPLHLAVGVGFNNIKIIKLLLEFNAWLGPEDLYGNTPESLAIKPNVKLFFNFARFKEWFYYNYQVR